jgi:hypothetical protein
MKIIFFLLLSLLQACNESPVESLQEKACPAIYYFRKINTSLNLNSPLSDYKILIDGVEVTENCLSSQICLTSVSNENNVLKMVITYTSGELPETIDLKLIEISDQEIVRLDAPNTQVLLPSSMPTTDLGEIDSCKPEDGFINLFE